MNIHKRVNTPEADFIVGTSTHDGHMYLIVRTGPGVAEVKLTEAARAALREVLGPAEGWAGVVR